jgi:hypothetical protein
VRVWRLLISIPVIAALTGLAYVNQATEPTGIKMSNAASRFLAGLTIEQKAKAVLAFSDTDRLNWQFVPRQDAKKRSLRKGLSLEEMTPEQTEAARELLRSGTSQTGYVKATTIMSLESILRELEKGGSMVRNPGWYFFTIFGTPSNTGRWGWRVEGHHLSLNFVIDGGKVVASTPAFFGANPATVKQGPRKGTRTLPEAEELAKDLIKALDPGQRDIAHQANQFPEIAGGTRAPKLGPPRGLAAAKMTETQREILMKLLQAYANRMPANIAQAEMDELKNAGFEDVHFAFAGEPNPSQQYTYRVQGPAFVVEFLNVQADSAGNPANHIHSAWRSIKNDFGLPN